MHLYEYTSITHVLVSSPKNEVLFQINSLHLTLFLVYKLFGPVLHNFSKLPFFLPKHTCFTVVVVGLMNKLEELKNFAEGSLNRTKTLKNASPRRTLLY